MRCQQSQVLTARSRLEVRQIHARDTTVPAAALVCAHAFWESLAQMETAVIVVDVVSITMVVHALRGRTMMAALTVAMHQPM